MSRDRLLALLKDVRDADGCHVEEAIDELKAAIDWLEDPHARFDVTVGEVLDDLFGPAK